MRIVIFVLVFVVGLTARIALAGVYSEWSTIGDIRTASTTGEIWIYRQDGGFWSGTCATVYVPSNSSAFIGEDGFLSLAITAKLNNSQVQFFGDCDTQTNMFTAHSITIK